MDDLSKIAEELVVYLRFHIAEAIDGTDPRAIATAADSACTYFQAVGICELLLDAEVDPFFHHMIRSARARRWLLERRRTDPAFPLKPTRASNTKGCLAAIVAKDWDLAREIATLSPVVWLENMEYQDDFWYAHFLHRLVAGDEPTVLQQVLHEYEDALEGDEPPRFRLCRGVVRRDQDQVLEAFDDLLAERSAELAELRKTSVLATDDLFRPFAAVYVEGLAWLRLLVRAGFTVAKEYPLCPSLALADEYAAFVPSGLLGG